MKDFIKVIVTNKAKRCFYKECDENDFCCIGSMSHIFDYKIINLRILNDGEVYIKEIDEEWFYPENFINELLKNKVSFAGGMEIE